MRTGVIASIALAAAGCGAGGSSSTPDAAPDPDAPRPDAMVDAAPLAEVETMWLRELPQTRTLDSAVTVDGGVVIVGSTEIFRFDDDGNERIRRPLPEEWNQTHVVPGAPGTVDLVVSTWTDAPALSTLLVRLDATTLEPLWTYVVDPTAHVWARPTPRPDGTTSVVAFTTPATGRSTWAFHEIDANGAGTMRAMDLGFGWVGDVVLRPDGQLASAFRGHDCTLWTLDPDTLAASTSSLSMSDACNDLHADWTSGALLVHFAALDLDPEHQIAMAIDPSGAVVLGSVELHTGLAAAGSLISETHIAGVRVGRFYDARLDDVANVRERLLPTRPGGFVLESVMASDGERAFVAYLDEVSSFDTVLRVARLRELH